MKERCWKTYFQSLNMKKKIFKISLLVLLMLPMIALAHFWAFPEETRCILIRFSDFEKKENVYFRKDCSKTELDKLFQLETTAANRVKSFWGNKTVFDYSIIYCNTLTDFNHYGHVGVPAATQLKCGAYIVLQEESLDKDIIAHEMAHTVLYNNIGWYKTKFKIPTWFDEGLAMQVDDRDYYSIDSLLAKQQQGLKLPDIRMYEKPAAFFSGTGEEIMLHFSTAKYAVHEWLKTHSLEKFIDAMNNGKDFEEAWKQ